MEQYMIYLWLALVVIFACVEAATVNIITMWFAVGAIAAVVVNLLGGTVNSQLVMFTTVSVVSLIILKPIVTKILKSSTNEKFNTDLLIGQKCKVTAMIENGSAGEVKIEGKIWRAKSVGSNILNVGDEVEVLKIKGVTLDVKKAEEE